MEKKKSKQPNPVYLRGLEEGMKRGEREALDKIFEYIIFEYIKERNMTIGEIEEIVEKTAWKIHKHLLDGVERRNEE